MTNTLASNSRVLLSSLNRNQTTLDRHLARLGSGTRLLTPADDPAGTRTAAKADSQRARLAAATINIQNGTSRLQTTDSYLTSLGDTLTRMSELATYARNEVLSPDDVDLYRREFVQLQEQLRTVIGGTQAQIGGTADIQTPLGSYNGAPLFGADGGTLLAIGVHADETLQLPTINLRTGDTHTLIEQDAAGTFTLDLTAPDAIATLQDALSQITTGLIAVGATQSRLSHASDTINSTDAALESQTSRIRDVDIAASTTALVRQQVLTQSHTSMLSQTREMSTKLLSLLTAD
ncbi:flagellin [Opitutaceae bacterium TAV4]|nr:flagellin [Opitutaceae bacterium TAV4]RRK02753.1 flagellin [Opitutaceae bacterium TAV3]